MPPRPRNYRQALADPEAPPPAPEDDDPTPEPDPGDPAALGDAGKRALDRLKRQNAELKARADAAEAKAKEYEDAQLSDQERRDRELADARAEAAAAKRDVLIRDIAADKGLSPAQARWLQGTSQEEIEASADELLATFPAAPTAPAAPPPAPEPATPRVPGRPVEAPRGGGTPDEPPDEMDPHKLASSIPRR